MIETVDEQAQHEIDAGLAGEEEKVDIVGRGANHGEFAIGLVGTGVTFWYLLVFVFVVAALVGLFGCVIIGWKAGAGISGTVPHSKSINYALSVLPMFILIGFITYHGGLTCALFRAARNWFGWFRWSCRSECFCYRGLCSGFWASLATAAVFSRVAIPHMLENGYDRRLAASIVAAEIFISFVDPPSAILVIYAIIVEEVGWNPDISRIYSRCCLNTKFMLHL